MEFVIEKVLPNGLGRVGVIKTAHGEIKTPAFMAVGTRGYVRFISADDLHELGAQAMLSNGYHLRRQAAKIAKAGGLAEWKPLSFDQPFPFTEPAASRPVVTGETCFGRSPLVAKSSLERESLLKAHELRPDGLPAKSWQGPTLTDSGGFQVM